MSGTFSGFSEDDIKKLKSNNGLLEVEESSRPVIKAKRRVDQNNTKSKITQQLKTSKVVFPIPDEAKLGKKEESSQKTEVLNQPVAPQPVQNGTRENLNSEVKSANNSLTLDTCKIEKRVIDLDEFQARQKLIEEQNRRRKELLAKALADRTKQTEVEARRLKEIQNEFKKLDALLSNDVAILRHQIELASLDFMEAQKKYNKIEKEFLEAKLNLHQRFEKKEMLTEHLCAIIEKNEERKAEKLNELMDRLIVGGKTLENENINSKPAETEIKNPNVIETVIDNSSQKECSTNTSNNNS